MNPERLVRNNLLVIGTAAVLAVYTAGYARTRAAAQRFAEADGTERRAPLPQAHLGALPIEAPAHRQPAPPVPGKLAAALAESAVVAPAAAPKHAKADATPAAAAAPPAAPVATPVVDTAAVRSTAQAAADSAAQSDKQPALKDGEYYGWGTSRHGDIQAGIEIKGGRISAAWIQQCLTRYSCSWISALPGQVVARQSPETDFVSGATQSTNAFYYGVVQALSQAK